MEMQLSPEDAGSVAISATSSFILKEISSGVGGWASSLEAPLLSCWTCGDGKWSERKLAPGKTHLKAAHGQDSDIPLQQSQTEPRAGFCLRLVYNLWFVIETSPDKCMRVNGARRPQTTLKAGDACLLQLGDSTIALSCASPSTEQGRKQSCAISFNVLGRAEPVPLGQSSLIGSNPSCAVRLPKLPAFAGSIFHHKSRPHLHALKLPEGQLKTDAGDALAPRELWNGSEIFFGETPLGSVSLPKSLIPGAEQASMDVVDGRLALLELSGDKFGVRTTLPASGRSLSIGRNPENHLVIDSPKISRKHALLAMYDNSVLILDSSSNGTFVEGERIAKKKVLYPGEIVQFGDKKYLLCHSD